VTEMRCRQLYESASGRLKFLPAFAKIAIQG
jgi:hypothetical protein